MIHLTWYFENNFFPKNREYYNSYLSILFKYNKNGRLCIRKLILFKSMTELYYKCQKK